MEDSPKPHFFKGDEMNAEGFKVVMVRQEGHHLLLHPIIDSGYISCLNIVAGARILKDGVLIELLGLTAFHHCKLGIGIFKFD